MIFRKTSFGLDISDYSIEVLQLNRRKKAIAFNRVLLGAGIVRDGIILDKDKLTEKVKEAVFLARTKTSRVIMSLPESKVFTNILKLPKDLKNEELINAVAGEAAKAIPLEIDDIHWDFQVLKAKTTKTHQYVLYVGTLKEIIDDYIEVLDRAGLEAVAFEIESLALGRALFSKNKPKSSSLVVDIGARTTNFSIFDKKGIMRVSSILPHAGFHLTKHLSEILKISLKEAEKTKRRIGLSKKEEAVSAALEEALQPIVLEIKKNILYYNKDKQHGALISQIYLVGGSALLPKLAEYLQQQINLQIDIGLSDVAKQLKGKSILYNSVIGLALRGIKRSSEKSGINLLPLKARPKPSFVDRRIRENKYFRYLGALFGIAAIVLLGWVAYNYVFKTLLSSNTFEVVPEGANDNEDVDLPLVDDTSDEDVAAGDEETTNSDDEEIPLPEEAIGEVTVSETETGWLNVRGGPGTDNEIVAKVNPGETYPLLEEDGEWYKIQLADEAVGWVFSTYVTKEEK